MTPLSIWCYISCTVLGHCTTNHNQDPTSVTVSESICLCVCLPASLGIMSQLQRTATVTLRQPISIFNIVTVLVSARIFYCSFKSHIFYISAINDACLVYDGKLVIDSFFHTNDMSIRGAGSLTKFQRKYHAEKWSHANFNSKEVGIHVSASMFWLAWM